MSQQAIVIFCGLLLSVTAFSVDIMLPAFSIISNDLAASYSSVQLVIPIFILATGVGQIFTGPLSDRYGRKPVILLGLATYTIGAAVCLFASTIEILLLGRALQGLGASAGPVVGRAVLKDMFEGKQLARNIALATMIFAFGPIVAPLLGVGIMSIGSWRYIFFLIMLFGLSLLAMGALKLPETISAKNPDATKGSILLSNALAILRHPQSRLYALMTGPIMAIMITVLISLPRVFNEEFGINGTFFAVLFAIHGFGIIIGQIINRWMINEIGIAPAMRVGAGVLFGTSLLMLALYQLGLMTPYVLSGCMTLFATGYLVVGANANALAIDPHGAIAGFVSSFLGFSGQFVASIVGFLAAMIIGGDLATFIWVVAVLTGSVLSILVFKRP